MLRYAIAFPLICAHFVHCTHEMCPEEVDILAFKFSSLFFVYQSTVPGVDFDPRKGTGMSVWMSPQISRFDREVTFLSGLCFFFLRRGWLRQGVKGSVGKGKWPSCDSVLSWSSPTVHSPEEPQSSSLQCLPGRAGQADQQLCAGDLC